MGGYMSTISASTTTTTAYKVTADTTGTLVLQTGATPTTALTIGSDQSVTFAGAVSLSGNQTTTGNLTVNGNTTLGDASTDTILMTGAPSIGGAGLGMGMGFRNRILNGSMVIDQRNAGASVSIQTSNPTYVLDRWGGGATQNSKYTIQQNAGAVTSPAGYSKYLGVTSSSAYSVLAADYFFVTQRIEGFNTIDLGFGTASASSVTLSFWVRSSLTGTFGASITNSDASRTYPFTYTISSANTWEQKSVTIAGDTTGTWATNNTAGINVLFGLGVGSTYSGTAGSWSANTYLSTTGATSVVGTSGATFYITGVQLEKGTQATAFDYRPYGTELNLCKRYALLVGDGESGMGRTTTQIILNISFPQEMRAAPSATIMDTSISISDNFLQDFTSSGSTIDLLQVTSYGGRISFSGFTGLTQGRFYAPYYNTNGYIVLFSAEL
jgi:hypothetical protein